MRNRPNHYLQRRVIPLYLTLVPPSNRAISEGNSEVLLQQLGSRSTFYPSQKRLPDLVSNYSSPATYLSNEQPPRPPEGGECLPVPSPRQAVGWGFPESVGPARCFGTSSSASCRRDGALHRRVQLGISGDEKGPIRLTSKPRFKTCMLPMQLHASREGMHTRT